MANRAREWLSDAPVNSQDAGYMDDGVDDVILSPHLVHARLNKAIVDSIRKQVCELLAARGNARVLEIGAGHGSFTDHSLAVGATVTVTEMSRARASILEDRYSHNNAARVIFDASGDCADLHGEKFDVVLCMSVLHHIPDYLSAIRSWTSLIDTGGAFVSYQDPLWYPRRSKVNLAADRGAYYLWRVGRGDLFEGLKSVTRRSRDRMDRLNPRDMVEYHVLRSGCDEEQIAALLRQSFETVDVLPYWSTQSHLLQRAGERLGLRSTFGVHAQRKLAGTE